VVVSDGRIGLLVEENETIMFSVGASMEESSQTLVIKELSLSWRLAILPPIRVDSFAWWKTHEGQFPNVSFLAKQVFGILKSQIETKKMFNLVGVLITLKRCHLLQVQNWTMLLLSSTIGMMTCTYIAHSMWT
jgi:hypothetical protein